MSAIKDEQVIERAQQANTSGRQKVESFADFSRKFNRYLRDTGQCVNRESAGKGRKALVIRRLTGLRP